jgi:hypothetical protein
MDFITADDRGSARCAKIFGTAASILPLPLTFLAVAVENTDSIAIPEQQRRRCELDYISTHSVR